MGHRIFTGPFHALESRLLEEIKELQHEDPLAPVPVLLGSNILATYLRRQIALAGRAAANLRFFNFLDLARLLSGAQSARPKIPRLGPSVILESLLAENTPAAFSSVAPFPGFRDALLDTFRDLRDAGISAESFALSLRPLLGSMPDRRIFLEGIADLYVRFRNRVSLFHDVDEDFRVSAERISDAPGILGGEHLFVYGIYDVTGQQEELLDCLAQALSLTFFIPFVGPEPSGFALAFLERRKRLPGVTNTHRVGANASGTLRRLNESGFGLTNVAPGNEALADDGTCHLVSAPGDSKSAIEIVREVLSAVHDGSIAGFHEAAIILRHPEEDVPIVAEALRLRGIPYFIAGGTSFSDRPLSRAITALCGLQGSGFSRQAILASVELLSASMPEEETSDWDVAEWRSLTNHARFLAGIASWDEASASLPKEISGEIRALESDSSRAAEEKGVTFQALRKKLESARALVRGWGRVSRAVADWPETLSWREWADFLEARFEPLVGKSSDWPTLAAILDELGQLDSMMVIAGFVRLVSRIAMTRAISDLTLAHSFPEGKFQRSGVNLLSISAARGLRFPLVILPGLDEGRFPARPRQDPLLLDIERERLDPSGRLPRKLRRAAEEKLLFDMACRAASRRLVLLTSRLDESSDRERIPSQFFLRFAESLGGVARQVREINESSVPGFRSVGLENPSPRADQLAIDEPEIRLRLISQGKAHEVIRELFTVWPELLHKPYEFDLARWEKRLTPYDGLMTDREVIDWIRRSAGPDGGPVSASRLEHYAACPYRFFLERVMEIGEWREEEPASGLDPIERGQALHGILEGFLKVSGHRLAEASPDLLNAELRTLAIAELDKDRPAGIPDLLWEIECERLLRVLQRWLDFERARVDEGYVPELLECAFGRFRKEPSRPALKIRASSYEFEFRGRIDRVDFTPDRSAARITDYKSGKLPDSMKGKKGTLLMGGEKMQLAIYAAAIRGEFPDLQSLTAEYLHLQHKREEIVSCCYRHEKVSGGIDLLSQILEIIGDGIARGAFFHRAKGRVWRDGHCEYCPYKPVCGKDREQRQERKSGDAAVTAFLRMGELDTLSEGAE
jgi:ATP-dependent helicase/nuclease subunit B